MKVLTESGLMGFARAIAQNLFGDDDSWLDNDLFNDFAEDNVHDLFNYFAEEVYHEWTNENIAEQALKMVDKQTFGIELQETGDYRDELIEFLVNSEDFNVEMVGEKFAGAWDPKGSGVSWETVEWAIAEVHSVDDLIEMVTEGITEAKNNDDNVE